MRQLLVLLLILLSSPSWAMEHHTNILTDNKGNALKDATVYVYQAGTTNFATIFSDNGTTLKTNPFQTSSAANSPGAYDFYAANGVYDLVFAKSGYSFNPNLTKRIALFDVNDGGGGGGGGSSAFADITSGTNVTAAMIVGTGSSLSYTGGGSINASTFRGNTLISLTDGGTNQASWTANRCVRVNAGGTALEVAGADCSVSSPTFTSLTTGTNASAAMTVGTGASLTFSGSGSINASTFRGNATVATANGGTGLTVSVDDAVLLGNGTIWQGKVIPSCLDTAGQHLNYDPSTNTFACGTTSTNFTGDFSLITSGTNTAATMTVGTGAAVTYINSGTVNASAFRGNTVVASADGGTGLSSVTEDAVLLGTAGAWTAAVLPSCNNPTLSKLLYDTSTNSFSCGTDQSAGGGTTFGSIGSGTNTTATMTVGTGGVLTLSGTGVNISNVEWPNVVTVNAGAVTAGTTDQVFLCDTTAAPRSINLPAATNRVRYTVFNIGSNACTVNRAGADLINTGISTSTSLIIRNPGSSFWLQPDGSTTWYVGG